MADQREQILQAAQSHVETQDYDMALAEYGKLLQGDPNDTRVLLKMGDLQVRSGAFEVAIDTYSSVGAHYAQQGLPLKAVAVYKQVRELVRVHAPHQAELYNRVVVTLTELFGELGLVTDALQMLDEEANRLRDANAEEQAVMVYRRMVEVGPQNPLPHLRLAEGLCRVGQEDEAMNAFWAAAQLLLDNQKPDDALRVIERILHFRQEPKYAKIAASIYLDKGTEAEGMQALSRLQICFQKDPKDLETLQLLARAFSTIGQEPKAFEVQKEIARQAHEQGDPELFQTTLEGLRQTAPEDDGVAALTQLPPPPSSRTAQAVPTARAAPSPEELAERVSSEPPPLPPNAFGPDAAQPSQALDAAPASSPTASGPPPPPPPPQELAPDARDAKAAAAQLLHETEADEDAEEEGELLEEDDVELVDESMLESIPPGAVAAIPDLETPKDEADIRAHTRRALVDAQTFRELRLFDKAVETIQVALEFDPRSIELRELLRDVYAEGGDREGAIEEMLTMAAIYIEYDHAEHARTVLLNVLEAEPDHALARRTLAQLGEEAGAAASAQHSSADQSPDSELLEDVGSVEEALEESEFFVSRGMIADAKLILTDQLRRTPDHPLLLEALEELEEALANGAQEQATEFDLQTSLEELERVVRESQRPPAPGVAPKATRLDVENVFEKFKAGVRSQVAESDSATHYDLGIAYKDMNLLDDAILEFELAARDPARECKSYAMIGLIHADQDRWHDAIEAYLRGLKAEQKTPEQELSLWYDLALANEAVEELDQTIEYFDRILGRDASYRDVARRLEELRAERPSSNPRSSDDDLDRAFEELLGD